jgi:glyoxylase-like metal-dependent hydrolase (beta-lactamase superfamily II)
MSKAAGPVRVEKVVTSGTFSLDGGTWEVDNNVWVLGNDTECIIIDAAHDAHPIIKAVRRGAADPRARRPHHGGG